MGTQIREFEKKAALAITTLFPAAFFSRLVKGQMLKPFIVIAVLLLPINGVGQILDFQIVSANKGNTYGSTTFQSEFENRYGYSVAGTTILLVETPSFEDIKYIKQQKILASFGTEAQHLQLIYINSCTTKEDARGYHTTLEEAKRMNPDQEFRVSLLSMNGLVLYQSLGPLSTQKIRGIVNKSRISS